MSLLDNNPADPRALAVEASALTRRFGSLVAVNDLQLGLARQNIFGLLGPNGAGKTTTIKMLTTMLAPSAGSARIVGFDIVRDAVEVRRRIGYVSQMLSADGGLTGYENLLLFARFIAFHGKSGAPGSWTRFGSWACRRLSVCWCATTLEV